MPFSPMLDNKRTKESEPLAVKVHNYRISVHENCQALYNLNDYIFVFLDKLRPV